MRNFGRPSGYGRSGGKGPRVYPSNVPLGFFNFAFGQKQNARDQQNMQKRNNNQIPPEVRIIHVNGRLSL